MDEIVDTARMTANPHSLHAARPEDRPEHLLIDVYLRQRDGQWSAVASEYTVVGVGDTPDEAVSEMSEMLEDYLELCAEDGRTLSEARRPISLGWRLELELQVLAFNLGARVRQLLPDELPEPVYRLRRHLPGRPRHEHIELRDLQLPAAC